jgi:FKBP-type peptidyl-prolyl cis-trans isomerase FkpA
MRHAFLWLLFSGALGASGGLACAEPVDPSEVGEAPRARGPDSATKASSSESPSARIEKADGLVVDVIEEGAGPRVREGDRVTLHCVGKLAESGVVFGSSESSGIPLSIRLQRDHAILGLVRGLDGLRVGTRASLHIPSALAYGEAGLESSGIPANADLLYEVHVLATTDRSERR